MISVVLVKSVDIEVVHPGPCIEPKDGFLDLNLEMFLKMRFMSLMIKVKEKCTAESLLLLTKLSIIVLHRHFTSTSIT